tara:strand:- start:91 stop:786 length:696 start_codon:yes stop_codon:yes gene_type:complete
MPAYNEIRFFEESFNAIDNLVLINNIEKEIIIIDDFSNDGTKEIIERIEGKNSKIKKIYHNFNQGKGAAITSGIKEMTGDYMIIRDADMEYEAADINILVNEVLLNNADVVYGSRFHANKSRRILFFWHMLGNKILTLLSNIVTNLNLTDMETCYKLISKKILDVIILKEQRFGFEPEVTIKIANLNKIKNLKIFEVGISYNGRTYHEGKKINWKDGFSALRCIFIYGLLK